MPTDYDAGYEDGHKAGYEDGHKAGYEEAGYEDGHKAGYEEAEADIQKDAARAAEQGRFTVSMSSGLYTASLTEQPGVSEDSVVSAYDALGKLVARLEAVRTMGRLVL